MYVKSNGDVFDLLDVKFPNSFKIEDLAASSQLTANVNSINKNSSSSSSAFRNNNSEPPVDSNKVKANLANLLVNKYKIPLKSFFYLKIINDANDLELSFITGNSNAKIKIFFFNFILGEIHSFEHHICHSNKIISSSFLFKMNLNF
jgi:hypothetical protein